MVLTDFRNPEAPASATTPVALAEYCCTELDFLIEHLSS
jgi:hypothetical protein